MRAQGAREGVTSLVSAGQMRLPRADRWLSLEGQEGFLGGPACEGRTRSRGLLSDESWNTQPKVASAVRSL